MCELCHDDETTRVIAAKRIERLSVGLRELADFYHAVSGGRIKPHTKDYQAQGSNAAYVLRALVEDWV